MDQPKENNSRGSTAGKENSQRGNPRNSRRGSSFERPKPEFDQKIVSIRRVTRVTSGGRRFSFSVAIIAGDKKGSIGLGLGKAGDTALAINKALQKAKKNMIKIKLTKTMSIPHELTAKFASSQVRLMPNKGRGLVAGSVVRDIINIAGIKDITGKIVSNSKNKLNNAKAVLSALSQVSSKYTKPVAIETVVINSVEVEKPLEPSN